MRVPKPAAGTITKTFIKGVQYKSVPGNFQIAAQALLPLFGPQAPDTVASTESLSRFSTALSSPRKIA
jgi:hypothetical protein